MGRFEQYFLMDVEDVKQYVITKTQFFDHEDLTVSEIGDGNLNYVFRIEDHTGKSIILKHSGTVARISDEFQLSADRVIREGKLLQIHGTYVPQLVPEVYLIDEVMKCVIMEDLKDYQVLRTALQEGVIVNDLGKHLGTYLAETLIRTSDFVLKPKDKKALQKEMINPELCEISEDLVYTEPFYDHFNRNEISERLLPYVERIIYSDETLKDAVAKAKLKFLNQAQSLIHGDLHSGSVFVNRDALKVIDPEFGFFGPAGYDVGNVLAHLFFAYAHAKVHGNITQAEHIQSQIDAVIETFKQQAFTILENHTHDVALHHRSLFSSYIREILQDSYVICGLELIRRIVGLAKVSDITSLDEVSRLQVEVKLLLFAKQLIKHPEDAFVYPSIISIYEQLEGRAA
ncbi:S-methyl-5-thioribose kinase [Macrococcus sp. DPC7161]|uniref:S-methyl-5-thioribose kinase n=1 Tax=Macrococcus sp. DPC7161 TaxID=2507060 RepID=UPI00100B33F0|nr:S-methyl-5-thioribose kinase [Macrococcus sp. DPC7161]RXK17270.1 S-methyl-5-thioribose kinase [Macrococcus sp. DPC7161]